MYEKSKRVACSIKIIKANWKGKVKVSHKTCNNAKLTQTLSVRIVKSGSVVSLGTEMVKGPIVCVPLEGQYCSHLVFPPSTTLVTMTTH